MGNRLPGQLSGGQQQRVALARALVFEPQLVLMDEPLGALDKQLREHMQIELKELHRQLGVTFVYVTHDQGEALTMSDRVAVFNEGVIQQLSTRPKRCTKPRPTALSPDSWATAPLLTRHHRPGRPRRLRTGPARAATLPARHQRQQRPGGHAGRSLRCAPNASMLHGEADAGRPMGTLHPGQAVTRRHLLWRPPAPALCHCRSGTGQR